MEKKDIITWNALEYEHRERSPDWFWALGIIVLSLVIASIIYKNYLFAIFIVIAALMLARYALRPPEEFQIEINKKGVRIKNDFYPYKKLKSFYVDHTDEARKKLIIHSDRPLMPHIILPIEPEHDEEIRDALLFHLKEEEMREPVSHKIMEYLGF